MQLTLIKIFAKGFYKKYTKAFMFGFCMFFSYCIFIQTAGEFLTESSEFWTMFISLKVATDPFFIGFFWLFALFYALLFSKYIRTELKESRTQFIQYTLNGMSAKLRFRNWSVVVLIGFVPLFLFAFYSLAVGYYIAENLKGIFTVLYLIILLIATVKYTDLFRLTSIARDTNISLSYSKKFNNGKLNFLNLYNHFNNSSVSFIATKLLNLLVVYILTSLFDINGSEDDPRYAIFLAMTLACFNSVLLYKDFVFEGKKLLFMLNIPKRAISRFFSPLPYYLLLVLPEIIFITFVFSWKLSAIVACSIIVFLFSIKSFISLIGNSPLSVLKFISVYYFIVLFLILYGYHFFVLPLTFMSSFFILRKHFRYEKLKNNQD